MRVKDLERAIALGVATLSPLSAFADEKRNELFLQAFKYREGIISEKDRDEGVYTINVVFPIGDSNLTDMLASDEDSEKPNGREVSFNIVPCARGFGHGTPQQVYAQFEIGMPVLVRVPNSESIKDSSLGTFKYYTEVTHLDYGFFGGNPDRATPVTKQTKCGGDLFTDEDFDKILDIYSQ